MADFFGLDPIVLFLLVVVLYIRVTTHPEFRKKMKAFNQGMIESYRVIFRALEQTSKVMLKGLEQIAIAPARSFRALQSSNRVKEGRKKIPSITGDFRKDHCVADANARFTRGELEQHEFEAELDEIMLDIPNPFVAPLGKAWCNETYRWITDDRAGTRVYSNTWIPAPLMSGITADRIDPEQITVTSPFEAIRDNTNHKGVDHMIDMVKSGMISLNEAREKADDLGYWLKKKKRALRSSK